MQFRIETSVGAQLVTCDMDTIMSCAGNLYEYCGGPSFMSLYYATGNLKRDEAEGGDYEDD